MAYFKISLLTTQYKDGKQLYFEDIITELESPLRIYKDHQFLDYDDNFLIENENNKLQEQTDLFLKTRGMNSDASNIDINRHHDSKNIGKHYNSLTYNEKLTKSLNGQKTLTFSLNKNLVRQDEIFENPFATLLINGSQLMLTDHYNNQFLFTVTNIKYTFKETNVIYDVTCQDSFSYQLSRQNEGYTIENDPSSQDFIGAKTLDWWVKNKIEPECYLFNYKYIPLFEGLYEDIYSNFKYWSLKHNDIKRIIKEAYIPPVYDFDGTLIETNDKDYFETIPFSCSGSNALNALISLAGQLNMQVVSFEHLQEVQANIFELQRYFWFEPLKNDKRIGLNYSPYADIQTFNLSHNSQSLTTILNVEGPTYDDEIVTLIPKIPGFFKNLFISDEWEKSTYYTGYYRDKCYGYEVFENINTWVQITYQNETWFYLNQDISALLTNKNYPLYSFFNRDKNTVITTVKAGIQQVLTPSSNVIRLATLTENNSTIKTIYRPNKDDISFNDNIYVVIKADSALSLVKSDIFLYMYRNITDEERLFAQMADKCPWLENKIINFEYFYNNNIISKEEYLNLTNYINNDLRKVNGQLLYYSDMYYNAMHKQTQIIADLTNRLDAIGGACQADFITPLTEKGGVALDINSFENAYSLLFNQPKIISTLLNLPSIKEEYLTKYINAQQRFLRNIYNFREYFNSPNSLYNSNLYKYTLTINSKQENILYSFDVNNWIRISNNFNYYCKDTYAENYGENFLTIYEEIDNQIIPVTVASAANYKQLYIDNTSENIPELVQSAENYNEFATYYIGESDGQGGIKYSPLSQEGIFDIYLKESGHANNYYYYSQQYIYNSFEEVESNLNLVIEKVDNNTIDALLKSYGESNITNSNRLKLLKQYIPLNTIYSYDYDYKIQSEGEDFIWYRLNSEGYNFLDYFKYLKDTQNSSTIYNPKPIQNPYDNNTKKYLPLSFVNPNNESKFYRRVISWYTPTWTYAIAGILTGLSPVAWLLTSIKEYTYAYGTAGLCEKDVNYQTLNGSFTGYDTLGVTNKIVYTTDTSWETYYRAYIQSFTDNNGSLQDIDEDTSEAALKEYFKHPITGMTSNPESIRFTNIQQANAPFDFFDYYTKNKYFGYTIHYALAHSDEFFYRTTKYLQVGPNEIINPKFNYYILILNLDDDRSFIADDNIGFFETIDDIAFYPITTRLVRLNVPGSNSKTLDQLLTNQGYNRSWVGKRCLLTASGTSTQIKAVFYRQDLFTREEADSNSKTSLGIYDKSTNDLVHIPSVPNVVLGNQNIYKVVKPTEKIRIHPTGEFSMDEKYFESNDINAKQIYTIEQINSRSLTHPYYYIYSPAHTVKSFNENLDEFTIPIIKITQIVENNKLIGFKSEIIDPAFKFQTIPIAGGGVGYENDAFRIICTKEQGDNLSSKTNADFWYAYKDRIDEPILMQQAIAIETQLTEYWSQAYTASKYCEWFLPESWTDTNNENKNIFNKQIFIDVGEGHLEINNYLVPFVNIFKDNKGNTQFPRYRYRYILNPNNLITNTLEYIDKERLTTASNPSILYNTALQKAFTTLKESLSNWCFEEIGKTTYYYVDNGSGLTWDRLVSTYGPSGASFPEFSGWYVMFYRLLKYYINDGEEEYFAAKKAHDEAWQKLHLHYGFLLLESTYKDENSTNAEELYKMAEYYFKDKNEPERAYNITVIDTAALSNYDGSEIRIGDGIQVRASELYNGSDNIYKSLSQYLFVTDISYNLRQVTDISLTVNAIKYQDKLIQRLVKLMK